MTSERSALPVGAVAEFGGKHFVAVKVQRKNVCFGCVFDNLGNPCVHNGASALCGGEVIFIAKSCEGGDE